jgi:hypothetical protein
MIKAKDHVDGTDEKLSQDEAKEEVEKAKKTSIKIVSLCFIHIIAKVLISNHSIRTGPLGRLQKSVQLFRAENYEFV